MSKLKIGILGGIGPEATGNLYLHIIRSLQEKKLINSNSDFPQIVVNSIPAPELVKDTVGEEDLVMYLDGLRELDSLNLDFILMCCNTIHLHFDKLQKNIKTPIIDLRKLVIEKLNKLNINSVTVLGTKTTISLGLYDSNEFKFIDVINEDLDKLIKTIIKFNNGIDKEDQILVTEGIVKKYSLKSDIVVLGCTEFAAMLKDSRLINLFDPLDCFVDYIVRKQT